VRCDDATTMSVVRQNRSRASAAHERLGARVRLAWNPSETTPLDVDPDLQGAHDQS